MVGNQVCEKCLKKMRFGYAIKDEIWNQLPREWMNKVLCIECFLEELEKEVPKQRINLNDFCFLAVVGDGIHPKFGGMFIDNDYGKNRRIYLD